MIIETREKGKMTMKAIKNFFMVLSVLGMVWCIASWIDVVSHNLEDACYQWWNIFTLILAAAA